ncbi:DUF29 domain-containing protein [Pseudanabaena sp. FACHB-1998]|uniref:DUF29 domain-containing protein n=1 Tax=Pseudanabaena sp. FACHB-1998 TaxID=2692858 RepID=UPI0016804324|nr:DUF29 domain-containing protein [Pseudanabaena sp. FACHB-1998]MBD2177171.1 DUF29 domain-containing protein [Pseudanabaena sp. FACHB-1998]
MAIASDTTQAENQAQPQQAISHHDLYEQDFCLWIEKALELLREGNLKDLDLENLLEEIEDMSNSQKQALESNLKILLMHLLKYQYQPDKRSNSWRFTIVEHRQRIHKAFKNSPSLKRYFLEEFADVYLEARKLASVETGIAVDAFPVTSPFAASQVLDEDYLPE